MKREIIIQNLNDLRKAIFAAKLGENFWIWNTYGWIIVVIDHLIFVSLMGAIEQLLVAIDVILVLNDHHRQIGVGLSLLVVLRLVWHIVRSHVKWGVN